MKPSESHDQQTFVMPRNSFQEVDSVDVIVCIAARLYCEMLSSTDPHLLCWSTWPNCGCLGNKWEKQQLNSISYPQETKKYGHELIHRRVI